MRTEKVNFREAPSIEILRGVAAFGIVGCHLALGEVTAAGRWVTHFCDFNVAVFSFVAGYLMWSGLFKYSAAEYVKRRAWRLLPAYAVWSVVYLAVSFGFKVLEGSSLEQYGSVDFWVSAVFKGGASCHLWFVACLFYVQALMRMVAGGKRDLRWGAVFGVAAVLVSAWLNGNAEGELKWFGTYPLRLAGFLLLGCSFAAVRSGMREWGLADVAGDVGCGGMFSCLGRRVGACVRAGHGAGGAVGGVVVEFAGAGIGSAGEGGLRGEHGGVSGASDRDEGGRDCGEAAGG